MHADAQSRRGGAERVEGGVQQLLAEHGDDDQDEDAEDRDLDEVALGDAQDIAQDVAHQVPGVPVMVADSSMTPNAKVPANRTPTEVSNRRPLRRATQPMPSAVPTAASDPPGRAASRA